MNFSYSLLNLVATINMSAHNMRKVEVAYELKIRGLSADGSAGDLRKRLSKAMANNVPVDDAVVNSLDPEEELQCCKDIFEDVHSLVSEYEGDFNDTEYQRISTRLWHLYPRIGRIPIVTTDSEDSKEDTREKLLEETKKLMDSFLVDPKAKQISNLDKISKENQAGSSSKPQAIPTPLTLSDGTIGNVDSSKSLLPKHNLVESRSYQRVESLSPFVSKSVPVYKWGLKFDNQAKQTVGAFLERVEELSRARGVTHKDLFESAVDLFSGQALIWYRSVQSRVNSWEELKREMKIVFQAPDYNFRLMQEIFSRTQGENESIDLYIAAMEGLYSRLSEKVPEATRLAQIYHNLHPQLHDRLALCDIQTLEDLRCMGRKVEASRLRASVPRQHPRSAVTLEPDLAYEEGTHRRGPCSSGKVFSLNQQSLQRTGRPQDRPCWNCGESGHMFRFCKGPMKRFCYGCGNPDKTKRDCNKCGPPKNL